MLLVLSSSFLYDLFHDKTSQWRNHAGQGFSTIALFYYLVLYSTLKYVHSIVSYQRLFAVV